MNYIVIKDTIKNAFEGITEDIYFGDALVHFTNDTPKYSSVIFGLDRVTVSEDFISYSFNVTFADRLENGTDNTDYILCNALATLEKGFDNINTDDVELEFDHIYTPFKQKFSDVLAGYQCDVIIRVPNDMNC